MTPTPTPTVYRSRSRTTRRRLLVLSAVLALILAGFLVGRLQGGSPAAGSGVASSSPSLVPSSGPPSVAPSTPSPTTAKVGVDAYAPIQAENASAQTGIEAQDTEDVGGGKNIGWVGNGDSLRFDTVNFGDAPATQLIARVASEVGDGVNGRMEIRIDSPGNAPIGSLPVKNTGGWQNWISQATDVAGVTGVHTIFVTFAADRADDFLNLNYFKFEH